MKDDGLKTRVRFSATIDKETYAKLKQYSQDTMIPFSRLLDVAIERLLIEGVKRD